MRPQLDTLDSATAPATGRRVLCRADAVMRAKEKSGGRVSEEVARAWPRAADLLHAIVRLPGHVTPRSKLSRGAYPDEVGELLDSGQMHVFPQAHCALLHGLPDNSPTVAPDALLHVVAFRFEVWQRRTPLLDSLWLSVARPRPLGMCCFAPERAGIPCVGRTPSGDAASSSMCAP